MPLSKWSRRHRRTFGDKKPEPEVFLEHHRVPPKPTNYYTEKKGECRFSGEARKRLWQRDRGYCAGCGIVQPRKSRVHEEKWHVDHIKPLWEQKGKKFDEIDLDYWREDNLQTLCTECHTKKTSREAAERAKRNKK